MVIWIALVWIVVINTSWEEVYAHPLMNTTCQKNETWIPLPKEHWPLFNITGVCRAINPNEELVIPCGTYEKWVSVPPHINHDIDLKTLCNSNLDDIPVRRDYQSVMPTSVRCIPYPTTLVISLIILLILSLLLNIAFVLLFMILGRL